MVKFEHGPADGVKLMLRRAPKFLQVVYNPNREETWDALDQLDDMPNQREVQSRKAHLDWCKERALFYVAEGELALAVQSMLSDLGKHEGTQDAAELGMSLIAVELMGGQLNESRVKNWIEGFN